MFNRYLDESGNFNIEISNESNNRYFEYIANSLEKELGALIVTKLDGVEQRYWDFKIKDIVFCLHQDNFLGISLFATEERAKAFLASVNLDFIKKAV